ncbi:MAG: GMP synthase [endosymbiont of Galathealinum brachiosum]|uniref:GMP synthase n=1 Tax=endosymbiont of Galathealinum brachiosum TaxID=2200906 RepID=A0A370DIF8_9GAMM|nr:MAG: GMP synthase [endosymbiont of Galathealinum brachiosum]
MKIGILETDIVDDKVIDEFGSYPDMFRKLLLTVDKQLSFQAYRVLDFEYPLFIDECDAYLITGSKFNAYDNDPWIGRLKEYVVELVDRRKKLIGICFGHQLIAQALTGQVEKSEKGWGVGVYSSHVIGHEKWMLPAINDFTLLLSHQDQIVKLPDSAKLIAGNEFCPNASYMISDSVLTFQGHPEFTVDYLKYIMNKRRANIGEQEYQKGIRSLSEAVDSKEVAKWIVNFIKN